MLVAIVMHLLSIIHGIAAGLVSVAVFHVAGLLLLPRRWEPSVDGPGTALSGAALYVLLCWVAISSRNIPLIYVVLVFVAMLGLIAAVRLRWLRQTLRARLLTPSTRDSVLAFCALYTLAYILILPPAGAYLPLAPLGSLDLVTYARYARHSLEMGTPDLTLATFEYLRSPASVYLLAWHSLLFSRDPLTAAMPTLIALAALFGVVAAGFARSVFGLSHRASLAIACVTISGPFFRWTIATCALSTLIGATVILYLITAVCNALSNRTEPKVNGPFAVRFGAACVLLLFIEPVSPAWVSSTLRASGELLVNISPLALLGWPGSIAQIDVRGGAARSAAVAVLPLVSVVLAGGVYAFFRAGGFERIAGTRTDLRLARALRRYVVLALVTGNLGVGAVSDPKAPRVTAAWRRLEEVNRQPFLGLMLKVDDEPDVLPTAVALYFLHTKKVRVIGSDVGIGQLPFDAISKHEPVFVHNLECRSAGQADTLSVGSIGCLLVSPPSMMVGVSYPFNRPMLFMSDEGMTVREPGTREPGGRWNTGATLPLKVTADPERARIDREMYLNLFLNPFVSAGTQPQRLVLRWGNDQRGETSLGEQTWISLPVRSDDWTGNRLWTLPVTIDFPDGRTMLFHELSLTETPRGRVVQPDSGKAVANP
jgi:hypothetical protein